MKTIIEQIKFYSKKIYANDYFVLVLIMILFFSGWAFSAYSDYKLRQFQKEVAAKEAKVAADLAERDRFKAEADKFKTENSLLRSQQDATAEILRANDKRLEGDAVKLKTINEERQRKYEEINRDVDVDVRRCDVCDDYARAGFKLSARLCGQCNRK